MDSRQVSIQRCVALDRDGTILVKHHYLADVNLVELLPEAGEGLRRLQNLGLRLVVVTNQSAVGRGLLNLEMLGHIHRRMETLLAAEGVTLDGIYFCPHTPEDNCTCRKPASGLLEQAGRDLGIPLKHFFVVGDNVCDIELAAGIGVTGVLVRTGEGRRVEVENRVCPAAVVDDLPGAAAWIQALLNFQTANPKNPNV